MNVPGYESLAEVLQAAYDQAATGKGKERHANDLPFDKQPMQQIARRRGVGFLLGQADKKTEEAQGMLERGDRDAWRREILGAINYLAGALVFTRGEQLDATSCDGPLFLDTSALAEGWTEVGGLSPAPGRALRVLLASGAECRLVSGGPAMVWPYNAAAWKYADESEQPAPTVPDSPVWFDSSQAPDLGRRVRIRNGEGAEVLVVASRSLALEHDETWRYVD